MNELYEEEVKRTVKILGETLTLNNVEVEYAFSAMIEIITIITISKEMDINKVLELIKDLHSVNKEDFLETYPKMKNET